MSQPETELQNDETTDEAVLDQLAKRREPAAEGAEAEETEAEETEETEEAEEETPDVDDDPEFDLGDVKAKKSEILAWKQGEMKDADYRRKTAEAAEVKREALALRERIESERTEYADRLDVLIPQLQTELVGDQQALAQLAITDPAEWVRQNAYHQQRMQQLQSAMQERQAIKQRTEQEEAGKKSERIQRELGALIEAIPEWRDPAVKQRELGEMDAFLRKSGYADGDVEVFTDHRLYLMARRAWQADKRDNARVAAKDKQVKPTPPKALRPGAATDENKAVTDAYKDAVKRAKSGKEDDLMALLAAKRRNA